MIEVRLLGQASIRRDGIPLRLLVQQRKRFALFAYLLLGSADGLHERSTLLALFWPELNDVHARQALRKALHFLRAQLGRDVIVSQGRHQVRVDEMLVWCDAVTLRTAAGMSHPMQVLGCYAGELLPGFHIADAPEFAVWLDRQRNKLFHVAYDAALQLARDEMEAGGLQSALFFARQAARIWPTSEEAAELTVFLLHRMGHNGEALEEYRNFAALIARDLDLTPSPALLTIVREIRGERITQAETQLPHPS